MVPPVQRSRWETAYARGANAVAEATATALQGLAVALDGYSRNPSPERLQSVKRALTKTREALRARQPPAAGGA